MFDLAAFQNKRTGQFGSAFYYFEELDSTNSLAVELASRSCAEGTIILANHQSRGKGRSGARWYSPPDTNLYFSLVLRPSAALLKFLPYMTALSLIRAIGTWGIHADMKWPNDVLIHEKKVAGILIETSQEENQLKFAVIGTGVNVNENDFPPELKDSSTSLRMERNESISRESFLAIFLDVLEERYRQIQDRNWEEFCQELEAHSSYLRGCDITIRHNEDVIEGRSEGLDNYGGLILSTASGQRVFYSGEVKRCRKK